MSEQKSRAEYQPPKDGREARRLPKEWTYMPNNPAAKSQHQRRVEAFMAAAGQVVPRQVEMPPAEVRRLRAALILEEALETIVRGLGCSVRVQCGLSLHLLNPDFQGVLDMIIPDKMPNMEELVDGCCDLKVVTTGTLSAAGVPDLEHQRMVDVCNLAKFGPGGHKDASGKWIKPPDWKAPKTGALLREQGWLGPE